MKLEDRLYGEVDDSCANCGVRDRQNLTVHHIDDDRSNNVYDNQIVLCHNCHTRHHQGKGLTTEQVRDRKRHLLARTITTFGLNAMKIAARNGEGVIAMPFLLFHLVDLGYMRKEELQMGYGSIEATCRFSISEEGKRVLQAWF